MSLTLSARDWGKGDIIMLDFKRFKIGFVAEWFDFWVGGYYNKEKRRLYLMIPFIGIYIERRK